MGSEKLLHIAAAILITVVILSVGFTILSIGRSTWDSGNKELSQTLDDMTVSKFDIYDGATVLGSQVIDVINDTYADKNIEVVVKTNDGKITWYNTADVIFGDDDLVDCTLVTKGENIEVQAATGTPLVTGHGYNKTLDNTATPGFILKTGRFTGSVQHDKNGSVRRITFEQK